MELHKALDTILDQVKDVFVKTIIRKTIRHIFTKFTFLSYFPFSIIVTFLVEKIVSIALKFVTLAQQDTAINAKVDKQLGKVIEANQKRIEVIGNEQSKTKEELDKIDDDLIAAARGLIFY